jgi:hypothetical protein
MGIQPLASAADHRNSHQPLTAWTPVGLSDDDPGEELDGLDDDPDADGPAASLHTPDDAGAPEEAAGSGTADDDEGEDA